MSVSRYFDPARVGCFCALLVVLASGCSPLITVEPVLRKPDPAGVEVIARPSGRPFSLEDDVPGCTPTDPLVRSSRENRLSERAGTLTGRQTSAANLSWYRPTLAWLDPRGPLHGPPDRAFPLPRVPFGNIFTPGRSPTANACELLGRAGIRSPLCSTVSRSAQRRGTGRFPYARTYRCPKRKCR